MPWGCLGGAPLLAAFARGGCMHHATASLRLICRTSQSLIRTKPVSPKFITSVAAPAPLFRRLHQSALYRIAMDVSQLFDSLVLRPNVEIIEARLPDGHRFARRSLCRMALPAPWHRSLRESLFHTLHRGRRRSYLRLAHEQVKVLRHDHVSQHNEAMLFADFFENF